MIGDIRNLTYLVLASCWETSRRVLTCSETTPTARKVAQARPAPSPNRLVKVEAIQSVESAFVFGGFCCSTFTETDFCCSDDEVVLSCWSGVGEFGCEGIFGGGGGGGGVWDEAKLFGLVREWERNGEEPEKAAIIE